MHEFRAIMKKDKSAALVSRISDMFMRRQQSQITSQSRNTFTDEKSEERNDIRKSALLLAEEEELILV